MRAEESVWQRHAGDDDEVGRLDKPAILRSVADRYPAQAPADYVRGHICRGAVEPASNQRGVCAGHSPDDVDVGFVPLIASRPFRRNTMSTSSAKRRDFSAYLSRRG